MTRAPLPPLDSSQSRPPSPDVLLDGTAPEPSPAGQGAEHGPAADGELPASEDQGPDGFRWIQGDDLKAGSTI